MPSRTPSPASPRTKAALLSAVTGVLLLMGLPDRELSPEEVAEARVHHAMHLEADELRSAIEEYRRDHHQWPGRGPGTGHARRSSETWLVRQLTMASNEMGEVVPSKEAAYPFGPYFTRGLPTNPINGLANILVLASGESLPTSADDESGWIYDPAAGTLWPNATGRLPHSGRAYFDL